jgi:uncharacterized protein YeaO (DUF488 family)
MSNEKTFDFEANEWDRQAARTEELKREIEANKKLHEIATNLAKGITEHHGKTNVDDVIVVLTEKQVTLSKSSEDEKQIKITVVSPDSFSLERLPKSRIDNMVRNVGDQKLDRAAMMAAVSDWSRK